MSEQPKCTICGEPMPPGEEMFKCHGFSGDCPTERTGMPEFMRRPMVRGAVCDHGSLKRSCPICERDDEIERLRALLRESRQYVMLHSPSGAPFDFPRELIGRIDAALPNASLTGGYAAPAENSDAKA